MTVTDAGGLSRTEVVSVAVSNQNEGPTDLTVAGGSVQENAAAGTVVATLGAVDADAGDTFTYTLAEPSALFEVVGNQILLRPDASVDFEAATSHQLSVTVTDAGGLSRTEVVSVAVSNQNEGPTDLTVAGGSVQENAAGGTVVATLGAVDADAGDTFTYTLAEPSALFEVVGNQILLRPDASVDFEAATSHQLSVTVTDAGGLSHTEVVSVAVSNQNEGPTDLTVAGGSVQENAAAGTVVATLGAVDADAGDTFTYTLAEPSALFEVVGNQVLLRPDASVDFEAATSHQLSVTVTDAGGLSRTEVVSVAVSNQNEGPTDLTVAGGSVQENAAAGTVVATLGAVDADAGDTFTYTLAEPSALFEVVGNQVLLRPDASVDFEAATSHQLSVTVTDAGGLSHTEVVSVAVSNQNEGPSDLTVAGGSVQENAAAGTVVATLGAVDADAGDTFTYTLAEPSALFEVVGNQILLRPDASVDFEAATSHQLSVTVTDAGGLSRTEVVSVAVTNQAGSFVGTAGNDVLTGTSEEDTILGLAGNDTLIGGAGNDTMSGGAGNDIYVVDAAGDVVTEAAGEGTDTVQSSVSYSLGANVENLTLTGSGDINATGNTLANTLTGNAGNNVLDGGAGNDILNAGAGDDTLIGGAGNDTMAGGAGNDTYVVDAAGDVVTEAAGEGTDTVQSSVTYTPRRQRREPDADRLGRHQRHRQHARQHAHRQRRQQRAQRRRRHRHDGRRRRQRHLRRRRRRRRGHGGRRRGHRHGAELGQLHASAPTSRT